jgi:hypothetical protein
MAWHETCFVQVEQNERGFRSTGMQHLHDSNDTLGRFAGRAGGNTSPPPTAGGNSLPHTVIHTLKG